MRVWYAPFLPNHYRLSSAVRAELDALRDELDLVLVRKSHLPLSEPVGCMEFSRGLPGTDMRICFRFKYGSLPAPLDTDLQCSRALCERLCERNHHRKDFSHVYESSHDTFKEPCLW